MGKVVVVGSFNVDHVWTTPALPRAGETLSGEYATGPGGKGFNQAVAARRAGAETSFVCALGDDAGGQLSRSLAAGDGIELCDQRSERPTGTAGIYVDGEGRNSIVIGAGANAALSAEFVASRSDRIAKSRVVLAQLESPADAVLAAMRAAREAGALAMLNPAPANAAVSSELKASVDLLTPNETEFASLLIRHVGERIDAEAVAALDQARLHALCRELAPNATVVVTLGASGCFVSHSAENTRGDESAYYRIPAEPARAVDTTGAGDAFSGALAASIATRSDSAFAQHVRFATRYAALSTERHGAALAMPHIDEMESG
ncbi:MAG TPA: ribokinase [Luteimonas sp.]|nr:ribokinase [Luteimonas sp.]